MQKWIGPITDKRNRTVRVVVYCKNGYQTRIWRKIIYSFTRFLFFSSLVFF